MLFKRSRKYRHPYRPDRIALVGYHDRGFVIARPAEPHAAKLQERTRALHEKVAGLGTNITDGIRVSLGLLKSVPHGTYRRMWLLTDGHPNIEASDVMVAVQEAFEAHVNINCIAFGANADEKLLQRIADATHNGKFVSVETLRELTDTLIAHDSGRRQHHHHRSETTVLCLDLSLSMLGKTKDDTRKIDAVEQSVLRLLSYKQLAFA